MYAADNVGITMRASLAFEKMSRRWYEGAAELSREAMR